MVPSPISLISRSRRVCLPRRCVSGSSGHDEDCFIDKLQLSGNSSSLCVVGSNSSGSDSQPVVAIKTQSPKRRLKLSLIHQGNFLESSKLRNAWRAPPRIREKKFLGFCISVRCGYILMLLRKRSSSSSNFSVLTSNAGSDAVSAFGMGSVVLSVSCGAKSNLATLGRFWLVGGVVRNYCHVMTCTRVVV